MVVSQASRRSADVSRSRAEAEALARLAGGMLGEDDPLRDMVSHLRSTFAFDGVSILLPEGAGWAILEATGPSLPLEPGDGESIPLSEEAVLVMKGPALSADDRRVLHVFTAQLNSALERRRLRREASDAAAIAAADQLRTAILRAVSHDLRTPLASIKASVTSLLQHDVEWSEPDREEFLETIDEESDRLNELVGNLLDMSRIESGALDVLMKPVGLEEVVARALASISGSTDRVEVDVSETLPRVIADPALLERALANLTSNALGFSPGDEKVRIEAGEVGDRIDLRIIDRGVGVPPAQRDRMFEPFQRLGDGGDVAELGENVDPDVVTAAAGRDVNGNVGSNVNGSNVNGGNVNGSNGATTAGGANGHSHGVNGVGLGLAVAKGFVEAIGGALILDDTPGGGLTAIIELRKVAP